VCATENGTPPTYQPPVKGRWNGTVTEPLSRVPSPTAFQHKDGLSMPPLGSFCLDLNGFAAV
jgi:hypothetical protein